MLDFGPGAGYGQVSILPLSTAREGTYMYTIVTAASAAELETAVRAAIVDDEDLVPLGGATYIFDDRLFMQTLMAPAAA